ncbi:MAG: linear amide C-N hydrolase, partial [Thermoactinospora sp.]|nr:linear amide C-N hydrolase [Thermoactinospora sp.]
RADPPDGYASRSVVDVFYVLGDRDPADLTLPSDRRRLAHAVLAPFDGMNEKGLAIGLASTPTVELPPGAGKPTVSDLRIIRLVLDRAATVDEAVELMRRYTLDFGGGPQVHYLIADRSGRSVVVEYAEDGLHVVEDKILTNITMIGTQQADRLADRRYRTLAEGLPTAASGLELLKSVAQAHTRWSIVYDLERLTADLVTIMRWERVHKLTLAGTA